MCDVSELEKPDFSCYPKAGLVWDALVELLADCEAFALENPPPDCDVSNEQITLLESKIVFFTSQAWFFYQIDRAVYPLSATTFLLVDVDT